MVIQHNIASFRALNTKSYNALNQKKSTERLSSGYKINRAADDAAGLTISEKLRSQIRGLNQAAYNIQDGISLTKVADGALSEIADMNHRQKELLIKAANGTNTAADRLACQKEINQLTEEIDRIFETTTFNEKKIFKGKEVTLSEYDESFSDTVDLPQRKGSISETIGTTTSVTTGYYTSDVALGPDSYGRPIYKFSDSERTTTTITSKSENGDGTGVLIDTRIIMDTISHVKEHTPEHVMIQSGPNATDQIAIRLYNMSASGYELDKIDTSTSKQAAASLLEVDSFLDSLNSIRSYYGAITNRLEHAYNIDTNTSENTQAAETKIRDADMAREVLINMKYSVINQATVAILSQTNRNPEAILQLLT